MLKIDRYILYIKQVRTLIIKNNYINKLDNNTGYSQIAGIRIHRTGRASVRQTVKIKLEPQAWLWRPSRDGETLDRARRRRRATKSKRGQWAPPLLPYTPPRWRLSSSSHPSSPSSSPHLCDPGELPLPRFRSHLPFYCFLCVWERGVCFHVQGPCGVVREITVKRCERGVDFVVTVFERSVWGEIYPFFFSWSLPSSASKNMDKKLVVRIPFIILFFFRSFLFHLYRCFCFTNFNYFCFYVGSWDSLGCGYGRVKRVYE